MDSFAVFTTNQDYSVSATSPNHFAPKNPDLLFFTQYITDCDADFECPAGMLCRQRSQGDRSRIVNCDGTGIAGEDYCYRPIMETASPTGSLTASPTTSPTVMTTSSAPTSSPVLAAVPTTAPHTGSPSQAPRTEMPTPLPTSFPVSDSPTGQSASPTNAPTPSPSAAGPSQLVAVSSVILGSANTVLGSPGCAEATDGTTDWCILDRSTFPSNDEVGFVATSGERSVVKKIRIYTAFDQKELDPASYSIEGRNAEGDTWQLISSGGIGLPRLRNGNGIILDGSTFDEGMTNRKFGEVAFENEAEYSQYRVRFPTAKNDGQNFIHFAEVELPGFVYATCAAAGAACTASGECCSGLCEGSFICAGSGPTTSPVAADTLSPSASPTRSPTTHPTVTASSSPSATASTTPSVAASGSPSVEMSEHPTVEESSLPSVVASSSPSVTLSTKPSVTATSIPSVSASVAPSLRASEPPTVEESSSPSMSASSTPSNIASESPSITASESPSVADSSAPSSSPTTPKPTPGPTSAPTLSPTTASPTTAPQTGSPSASPVSTFEATPVANVLFPDTTIVRLGGTNTHPTSYAVDGTTDKFLVDTSSGTGEPGFEAYPNYSQMSIVKGIRLYTGNDGPSRDPVKYVLEGRSSLGDAWQVISQGDLSPPSERNVAGVSLSSTYEAADASFFHSEVSLSDNSAAYAQYKVTFPLLRNASERWCQFAEIELPGLIIPTGYIMPTQAPATSAPTKTPTQLPSSSPTKGTLAPTIMPTTSPETSSPTNVPNPSPSAAGPSQLVAVSSVILGSANTVLGSPGCTDASDGTTDKCTINRSYFPSNDEVGFVATSGERSVVKKIRIYTANNYKERDPASYSIEGRNADGDTWQLISNGPISLTRRRNGQGIALLSTYDSPDTTRKYREVVFENEAEYSQYRVRFPTAKNDGQNYIAFAEVELPGFVYATCAAAGAACTASGECCSGLCEGSFTCA